MSNSEIRDAGQEGTKELEEHVKQIIAMSMAGINQPLWETRQKVEAYIVQNILAKVPVSAPVPPPLTKDAVLQWPDFDNWWEADGRFYDPDMDDVPWFDKRKFLAEYAFMRAKQFIAQTAALQTPVPERTNEPVSIGVCRDPRLRLKKPLPAAIHKDEESGQFVVEWARGDIDDWGHGDTKSAAMEDFADCAAELFRELTSKGFHQLSPHLAKEKSVIEEYFEYRSLAAPVPEPEPRVYGYCDLWDDKHFQPHFKNDKCVGWRIAEPQPERDRDNEEFRNKYVNDWESVQPTEPPAQKDGLGTKLASLITVESVWCNDCGETRPVKYDHMKCAQKVDRNNHDATDILCDRFHIVATLHHPSPLAKLLGVAPQASPEKK